MENNEPIGEIHTEDVAAGTSAELYQSTVDTPVDEDELEFNDYIHNLFTRFTLTAITDSVNTGIDFFTALERRKREITAAITENFIQMSLARQERKLEEEENKLEEERQRKILEEKEKQINKELKAKQPKQIKKKLIKKKKGKFGRKH